jgi:hypothetical protein
MLAATIVEELERRASATEITVLYFFVDGRSNDPESTRATSIIRSLVYQALQQETLPPNDIVFKAMMKSGHDRALRADVLGELFVALSCLLNTTIYVVIDALDECLDYGHLASYFLALAAIPKPRIKIFLTSRCFIETEVNDILEDASVITITEPKTEKDMHKYIDLETKKLAEGRRPIPSAMVTAIAERLQSTSCGMYLILSNFF